MKIKLTKTSLFLVFLLIFGGFLRIYKIGSNPPHLTADEASLGYNAFSILKTGRDEYGEILPIIFKSFGDYKPGLYVYLTIPFVFIFGMNEFSVRLPSALTGVLSIFLVYLILKEFFGRDRKALFGAFLLTINPWLINFSRAAWEVNVALGLTLIAIYFFLLSFRKNKYLVLSSLFFAFSLLCYQGAKLSSGIVVLILALVYRRELLKIERKFLAASIILGVIVSLPIIISFFQGKTGRLTVFSVFSYPRPDEYLNEFLSESGVKKGSLPYYLYYSEGYNFLRGVMGRYFNHFSGRFLFFDGDWQNLKHSTPNAGVMLFSDLILVLVGVYFLFREKITKPVFFILFWLLLSPLPSALSRDQVHAVRALNMAVPLVFVAGFGLDWIFEKSRIMFVLVSLSIVLSLIYYLDSLFIHQPVHHAKYWEYGYREIVKAVTPVMNDYEDIVVQQSYSQPYIYFLFYWASGLKEDFDPRDYQGLNRSVGSNYLDVGLVEKLDKIIFRGIDWSIDRGKRGTLFVGDSVRIPVSDSSDLGQFDIVGKIMYPDGALAFRVVEVK